GKSSRWLALHPAGVRDCQTPARPVPFWAAFGLAIPLSMLFFMEQNISSAMVNCPANKLRKGFRLSPGPLDRGAVMNGVMSCFGLPWVHGALPQLRRCTVVRVRETRITGVVSNVLIGPLHPVPVLDGLFVCMAITALFDNQLFERILLLFTE
uniref:HCO3_cotransp domain-containing protein n=1 Tax=Macrostomum lignano TaxID=282301 RepID=A0A1I8FI25_9PLAT